MASTSWARSDRGHRGSHYRRSPVAVGVAAASGVAASSGGAGAGGRATSTSPRMTSRRSWRTSRSLTVRPYALATRSSCSSHADWSRRPWARRLPLPPRGRPPSPWRAYLVGRDACGPSETYSDTVSFVGLARRGERGTRAGWESLSSAFPGMSRVPDIGQEPC
jgi:hypothetical protein